MENKTTSKDVLIAIVTCVFIGLVMYNVHQIISVATAPGIPEYMKINSIPSRNDTPLTTLGYPKGYSKDLLFDMGPVMASSQLSVGGKTKMNVAFRSFNSYDTDIQIYKMMLDQNKWTILSIGTEASSTQIMAKKGHETASITLHTVKDYPNMTLVTVSYQK
jgi:hypothetical protein